MPVFPGRDSFHDQTVESRNSNHSVAGAKGVKAMRAGIGRGSGSKSLELREYSLYSGHRTLPGYDFNWIRQRDLKTVPGMCARPALLGSKNSAPRLGFIGFWFTRSMPLRFTCYRCHRIKAQYPELMGLLKAIHRQWLWVGLTNDLVVAASCDVDIEAAKVVLPVSLISNLKDILAWLQRYLRL